MASEKQVEMVLDHLQAVHPAKFFKTINEGNAGVGAVLRYLHNSPKNVTAGNISEYMQVSTARVAVLLKKMNAQGLIVKESDATDARLTIVHISEKGEEKYQQVRSEIYGQVSEVIDKIGMEKMMEFITIANEFKTTVSPPKF